MTYSFENRTYPRFLDLFYRRFDVPLYLLPAPLWLDVLPGRAQPPLGYVHVGEGNDTHFVPDPERAPLIAEAFMRIAEGTPFQQAWRAAVDAGLTGRSGCRISASGLLHILRNPAYMGLLRYGQELYAGGLEPLVSEGTFKAAVQELGRQTEVFHAERLSRLYRKYWDLADAKAIEKERR